MERIQGRGEVAARWEGRLLPTLGLLSNNLGCDHTCEVELTFQRRTPRI